MTASRKLVLEVFERAKPILEFGPLAHDLLRGLRIVPKVRIFGLNVQFGKAAGGCIDVKDASSAIPWIA